MPFCFPQRLSAFRNGFLIFLNGFLIILNGFPLSKKSEKIYLRRQVYERSLFELRISRHLLPKLRSSRYYVYISPNSYLCAKHGHISVDCPGLKLGGPQNKAERMGSWYWSNVNMWNLPKLYKIRKKPILDPGATIHQWAGTGIWRCNTPKNVQKQQYKKVARNKCNRNWQGSRRNDLEAVNQLFRANEVEIKQKSLEALRLLRQADHALDKIHKYLADSTEYVWTHRSTNTSRSTKVKSKMSSSELTRKQDSCLSQSSLPYIWVRRVSWAVSTVLRMCVRWTRYVSTIVCARW